MKTLFFLLTSCLCSLSVVAQSSQADLDRALLEMEKRGELRRNGNQLIVLKQRPGDTAFMRQLYNKMMEKVETPYQIAFEIDPKYLKGNQQAPVKVKPLDTKVQVEHVNTPVTPATNISLPEGRYMIQLANGRALEAESNTYKNDGARVQIWSPYYALNQLWDLKSAGNGKYYFINVASGKVLKVNTNTGLHNGSPVQLRAPNTGIEETKWFIQSAGNQKYTIRSAAAANNKVLDVTGAVIDRGGAAIQLWDNTNAANQAWTFTRSYDSAVVRENLVDLRLNQSSLKHQALGIERGSCTYFGNIAALEAAYKKRGYGELNLSEEYFSIMSKVMYLEPYWSRVTSSTVRENQMATTMGGGSIFWLTNGLKLPTERDVPFRPSYTGPSSLSDVQRVVDDYNATQMTDNVIKAPLYYGATTGIEFADDLKRNFAEYEKVMSLGYEIDANINGGSHNVLIVGYDKTDPANPKFFVKDSYNNPPGGRCTSGCDIRPAMTFLSTVVGASYITAIREPSPFPEVAFMGEWNLDFDGHKGVLSVNHIPGLNYTFSNFGGALRLTQDGTILPPEKRIGAFYDTEGNAYRVNGKISGNTMEFYFDLATPNQRWDELRGRKFVYYLDTALDIMSGFHKDADGKTFGGYAIKGTYITHNTSEAYIDRFINSEWNLRWGREFGTVRCRVGADGSLVNGTFNYGAGSRPVSFSYDPMDRSTIVISMNGKRAKVKFLNHEAGMLAGNSEVDKQVVLMYKR